MLRLAVNTQLSEGRDLLHGTCGFFFAEVVFKIERFPSLFPFLSFFSSCVLFSTQLHVSQVVISLNEISL